MGYKRIKKNYSHPHSNHMYVWDYHQPKNEKLKVLYLRVNIKYIKKFKKALQYQRLRYTIFKALYGDQNNVLPLQTRY